MANAQLSNKPVYWRNPINREIRPGLPERYPAPWGWEKIVCGTAMQAEWWSNELRKQDKIRHQVQQEQREMIEAPMQKQLRSHIQNLMANARNNFNKEFLRRYLETSAAEGLKWKSQRESYLHAEAFEAGKGD